MKQPLQIMYSSNTYAQCERILYINPFQKHLLSLCTG